MEKPQKQRADDHPVKARIGHERPLDGRQQDRRQDGHDKRENHHVNEIDAGGFEDGRFGRLSHSVACGGFEARFWRQI